MKPTATATATAAFSNELHSCVKGRAPPRLIDNPDSWWDNRNVACYSLTSLLLATCSWLGALPTMSAVAMSVSKQTSCLITQTLSTAW